MTQYVGNTQVGRVQLYTTYLEDHVNAVDRRDIAFESDQHTTLIVTNLRLKLLPDTCGEVLGARATGAQCPLPAATTCARDSPAPLCARTTLPLSSGRCCAAASPAAAVSALSRPTAPIKIVTAAAGGRVSGSVVQRQLGCSFSGLATGRK